MSLSTEVNQQTASASSKARVAWIFFALNSKPTSMRRVLGERTAELEPAVIIESPISMIRSCSLPSLQQRKEPLNPNADCWKYHPLHFPERIPGFVPIIRFWNRRLLRSEIDRISPDSAFRVVCYDSPSQYHLVGKLRERISIYLAVDDRTLTVWGEPIRGELEAEKRLLAKVDKVVCVSEPLAETLKGRIPGDRKIPIHVLSNGYDERLFDPCRNHPEPQILTNIPKPRTLITGHISERIDWNGILDAAKARPQWNWIFVGPADSGLREKIGILDDSLNEGGQTRRRRLHSFPPVPVSEVPSLIAHCDVCAVPYRLNSFTLASSPLKGIEYLAMGSPMLSTRIPSLKRYDRAIQWVEEGNGESYAQALDRLAEEKHNPGGIQIRRAAVAGDAWADRLREFRSLVLSKQD
jgi:glycosyltransferase involved in cell wall biosynthesis